MADREESAIVVEALTKRYGDLVAVNDVSFTVRRGEVFAFLGPNGAGKTTSVEIIETIRTPTSGRVRVLGMDVTKRKRDIVRRIGVLPQAFGSFDRITVRESIRFYSKLFGSKVADVDGLMDLTDLQDKSGVQFKRLSGGLKQRLGIAIALVNDPEIVFLDEPTTGLDPHARHAVWNVLSDLRSKGKTVFLTTHHMEEAESLADTVAIISKGRLVAIGSPDELIKRHANYACLTLEPSDTGAVEAIERLGFKPVRGNNNTITVRVTRTEDVRDILGAIKSAGVPLPVMDVRKPSLEQAFLSLTESPRPEGAPADGVAA